MGWNSYIDWLIASSMYDKDRKSCINRACVIGLDGTKWTEDNYPNSLQPSVAECKIIAQCFSREDFTPLYNGVLITSHRYYLSEKSCNLQIYCSGQWDGIVMQKTHKAIIMAACLMDEKDGAMYATSYIAEYLKSYNL